MKVFGVGLGLTVLASAVLVGIFGRDVLLAGLLMGLMATGIETLAMRAFHRFPSSTEGMFRAYGTGLALRLAGVGVFAGSVLYDRTLFPPLPAGLGLLGVLVPLLLLELWWMR